MDLKNDLFNNILCYLVTFNHAYISAQNIQVENYLYDNLLKIQGDGSPTLLFYYTCKMRDALKNIVSSQLNVENGGTYFYSTQPYEVKNALGSVIAVVTEYTINKKGSTETFRLYRTKDGNWYDVEGSINAMPNETIASIKLAIDKVLIG